MRTLFHAALIAALAGSSAAGYAAGQLPMMAQAEAPLTANPAAPGAGATPIDPHTTSATNPAGDFETAIQAIGRNAETAAALRTMTAVGSVVVAEVDALPGAEPQRLDAALSEHAAGVKDVQESLQSSAVLHQALSEKGIDDTRVVAAKVNPDGTLLVYVK